MQLVLELGVLRAAVGGHGGGGAVGVGAPVVVAREGCVGFIGESGHNHWSHFSLHHFKSLFFFLLLNTTAACLQAFFYLTMIVFLLENLKQFGWIKKAI